MSNGSSERRADNRIPLNARIRIRAAGSNGRGQLCRVRDSSRRGLRLSVDGRLDEDRERLEVLTESGRPYAGRLEVRVVWRTDLDNGGQQIGCVFEA